MAVEIEMRVEISIRGVRSCHRPTDEGTMYLEEDGTINMIVGNGGILGIDPKGGIWLREFDLHEITNNPKIYALAPEGFRVSLIQYLTKEH